MATQLSTIHDLSPSWLKEKCNCRELYQLLFVKGADGADRHLCILQQGNSVEKVSVCCYLCQM